MARRQSKPNLTPLFAFMAVGIGSILVAALAFKDRKETESAVSQPANIVVDDPFGDMETKVPLPRANRPARPRKTHLAPDATMTDPIWVAATGKAKIAESLVSEGEKAKKDTRLALYEQKVGAAREIYNSILEDTADWEDALFVKYGDTDALIGQIKKERDRWFARLKKYRKVGGQ